MAYHRTAWLFDLYGAAAVAYEPAEPWEIGKDHGLTRISHSGGQPVAIGNPLVGVRGWCS
jgi:hypothetical protein